MDLQAYLVIVLVLFILGYFFRKVLSTEDYWSKNGVPTVKIQSFLYKIWNGIGFAEGDRDTYKAVGDLPYAGFKELGTPIFFIKDLELIKKVLVKDFEYFINRRSVKAEDSSFSDTLAVKEDQEWKDLRSLVTPTFTTGKIKRMFPIFSTTAKTMMELLKEEIQKGKNNEVDINLEDIFGRYGIDVICSSAFGLETAILKNPESHLAQMVKKFNIKLDFWLMFKVFASAIPFSSKFFRFRLLDKEADEYFINIIKSTMKHRETTGERRNDFLQLMIDVKNGKLEKDSPNDTVEMDLYDRDAQLTTKKNKIQVDDKIVIANCVGFFFGGLDTIVSVLSFVCYSLALNPEVQEKLKQELDSIAEKTEGDGEFTYEDILQASYMDKVINESMRMYTPSVRAERRCAKDYPLDGPAKGKIPKDSMVSIPIFQIHHDEKYYPNPEVFDPERFSAENKAKRSPYAFMPFGHGPRSCLGNRFALMEMKVALANLVMNFEIEPCAKSPIPLKFQNAIFLKAKGGMWLKLKQRN